MTGSDATARRAASSYWLLWAMFAAAMWGTVVSCGARQDLFGPGHAGATGGAGGTGGSGGEGARPPAHAEGLDILLAIDNSRSMADKQEILGLAVPQLIRSLVNPLCVDGNGVPTVTQPSDPAESCPPGGVRQLPPQRNIHLGVITTSLGGHGADVCNGDVEPTTDDAGHLITRGPGNSEVATYQDMGFLAWDPDAALDPPGEGNPDNLQTNLKGLLLGAGQEGCGYEASLESWYRFLIDPDPYGSIVIQAGSATLVGTDDMLLKQRADFLRPSSALVIVLMTDENDCSIRDGSQYYFAAQIYQPGTNTPFHLPRARAACTTDPNDPCCRSCGQPPGAGCDTSKDDCAETLPPLEDQINLRCFDQKHRFGIDFLYPIDRYATGLSAKQVSDRNGNVVTNPIFTDLNPNDDVSGNRDERTVFFAALIGVPWQDVARRNNDGEPDLETGKDDAGHSVGAFQNGSELAAHNTWSLILGEPSTYVSDPGTLPQDPLMVESVEPRSGVHPITGEAVAPPGAGPHANSINGHEYSIPERDDLQYACVFPLIQTRDCASNTDGSCDCTDPSNDNPLCQAESGQFGTTQFRAKGYPAIRPLQLVKAVAKQGVVGSICPAQLDNQAALDFGYVPLVRSMIEAIAPVLR